VTNHAFLEKAQGSRHGRSRLPGFRDEYVKSRLEAIVEFSELGDFMDRPIQIYSTGMFLRLAFSLFACLEPE